jgi:conjugative relaxase-like TrwC/TraI family protein
MVRYYTDAVGEERENYYTGAVEAGEPPGRWYGAGAESLGLSGQVRAQDMIGVYERFLDPRDPKFTEVSQWDEVSNLGHTGRRYLSEEQIYVQLLDSNPSADAVRRDELRVEAGRRVRHNVSYLDVTFSVPKSVTVAHSAFEHERIQAERAGDPERAAAWGTLCQAVEDAIWAGNNAAIRYLSTHAGYSRIGQHGGAGGRWIDAHDWTVASFFQHDSRDHDPQLHIHNVVLNRVQCSDGQWRTLDSRAVHAFKPAASAVGDRVTEAHLAASLGVVSATRPDGVARELVGVDQAVCELLSSRRRAIGPRAAQLVEAFVARHGREPTALQRDRLARQANLGTRRSKTKGETVEQRLDRVEAQIADELGGGLGKVAQDILEMARTTRNPRPGASTTSTGAITAAGQQHLPPRPTGAGSRDTTGPDRTFPAGLPVFGSCAACQAWCSQPAQTTLAEMPSGPNSWTSDFGSLTASKAGCCRTSELAHAAPEYSITWRIQTARHPVHSCKPKVKGLIASSARLGPARLHS